MIETEQLHTRFRFSPTGDVHLGHAALSWLSLNAAKSTGGSFVYRCEDITARTCASRWKAFKSYAHKNIQDLIDLGLEPSSGEVLKSHGLSPSIAVEYIDPVQEGDIWYKRIGFEEMFGPWPPKPHDENSPNDWKARTLGSYEQGLHHPYILVMQVIGDLITKRNCLIRGRDLFGEADLINAIQHLITKDMHQLDEWDALAKHTFFQYYLPKIGRTGELIPESLEMPGIERGQLGEETSMAQFMRTFSSSGSALTGGFYVKDVLEAGRTGDELFRFLGKVLFGSVEASECVYTDFRGGKTVEGDRMRVGEGNGPQWGVYKVLEKIVPSPVVDDHEWFRFLKTGKVD